MEVLAGVSALVLALTHLFADRIHFHEAPRRRLLSLSGGVAVAYVFVHLLPELSVSQQTIEEAGVLAYLESHVYLLALTGLALFYGVEHAARASRRRGEGVGQSVCTSAPVFCWHIIVFAVYNALIGYLLVTRERSGPLELLLFAVAIGLHFVVNDFGLRQHHEDRYHQFGRWVLSAAVLVGWGLALATTLSDTAVAMLWSLISGALVLNVLKEELPPDRESDFWAFAVGAAGYTALLVFAL